MKLILRHDGKELWFHDMTTSEPVLLSFQGVPFVAILWSNLSATTPEKMRLVLDKLLKDNCKYIVCGGLQCSEWEESADECHIARYPDFTPPESEHVMTTSHTGEPIEEVMFFALNNTNFDKHDFHKFAVFAIGTPSTFERQVLAAAKKEWNG